MTATLSPIVFFLILGVGVMMGYCVGRLNGKRWKP